MKTQSGTARIDKYRRGEQLRSCSLAPLQTTTMHLDQATRALVDRYCRVRVSAPCWSAGPWLAETGGADTGLAGAGRAALALDAAALASNPAAIGGLSGTTITAAVMPLELDFEFRGSGATPATATNQEGVTVIPALYASPTSRSTYGIGAYSYLGLSFDLGSQWQGRRVIEQAGLATFNLAPTVAWQATDRLGRRCVAAQLAEPRRASRSPTTRCSMDRRSDCRMASSS